MMSIVLDMLHAAYAGPHATKRLARDAQVSHRTAEKWWARLTTPRSDVWLRLIESNKEMRAELLARLGEHGYGADTEERGGVDASQARGDVRSGRRLDRPTSSLLKAEPAPLKQGGW